MSVETRWQKPVFWLTMLFAQLSAFIIFKDLADISQWVVQSNREFTMSIWYNRYVIAGFSLLMMLIALGIWWIKRGVCSKTLITIFLFVFSLNFYSGMLNPKLMFRAQQTEAMFVSVNEAPAYFKRSLEWAHFGDDSYAKVDDIEVLVLETDNGAIAYSDYYLLQPHVVKGGPIKGEEVIMTYCGLTNLGIAYTPKIGGEDLDLTVMTQLKNNLVLTDQNTGEAIQQLWGSMERSKDKGRMKEWPTIRMPFGSYKELYPLGKVFVNEVRPFSDNPLLATWDRLVRHVMMYPGVGLQWNSDDKSAFPTIDYSDDRLPMKKLVYAINVDDDFVAYTKDFLIEKGGIINVDIGGKPIVISYDDRYDVVTAFYNSTGQPVEVIDAFGKTTAGEVLARVNTLKSKLFWFILVEFYPQTDVNRV